MGNLKARADDEIINAKKLLLHYLEMALPNLDPDCRMEIGEICDHIVNAAKFETLRHIELNRAKFHGSARLTRPRLNFN